MLIHSTRVEDEVYCGKSQIQSSVGTDTTSLLEQLMVSVNQRDGVLRRTFVLFVVHAVSSVCTGILYRVAMSTVVKHFIQQWK